MPRERAFGMLNRKTRTQLVHLLGSIVSKAQEVDDFRRQIGLPWETLLTPSPAGLSVPDMQRFVKLLGMLGSDREGERINAARLVERLRTDKGLTWDMLLGRQPYEIREAHRIRCAQWRDADREDYRRYQREYQRRYTKVHKSLQEEEGDFAAGLSDGDHPSR